MKRSFIIISFFFIHIFYFYDSLKWIREATNVIMAMLEFKFVDQQTGIRIKEWISSFVEVYFCILSSIVKLEVSSFVKNLKDSEIVCDF